MRRLAAEGLPVLGGKGRIGGGLRRRKPGARQQAFLLAAGLVPQPGAEQFHFGRIDGAIGQRLGEATEQRAALRHQDGIAIGLGDRGGRIGQSPGAGREARHRTNGDMALLRGRTKRLIHHIAVSGLRDQGADLLAALAGGISDDALNLVLRLETEQIDAIARHFAVGGEGQDRHAAIARERCDRFDRAGEQRPDDDFGAFAQELLRRGSGIGRRAGILGGHQNDGLIAGIVERQFCGPHHRLGQRPHIGVGIIKRQDDADTDRRGAVRRVGQREELGDVLHQLMRGRW